ncbi:aspartyl-phosphate phosphatase Spo0E family protein [Terribacillus saccharophilus]|uniref:aspartyl-phosphate phosphatase Spo0E family protein n=1 Tax=Terribacillus saccharophilus TaxID=361277 RepID=UPI003D2E196C
MKHCLLRAIEDKRQEMMEHGLKYGLSDDNTVRLSQELDQLLNKLDNINKA